MTGARVLLVNPPLWNPYAPHLAVPLLAGVLKQRGVPTRSIDLSAESMRLLLSPEGVELVRATHSQHRAVPADGAGRHASLLFDAVADRVTAAASYLRSPESVTDVDGYRAARNVCQAVLRGLSMFFPGSALSLDDFALAYRPGRTADVMAATRDALRNPYLPVFEHLLAPVLRELPDLRVVGISVSADTQLIAALTAATVVRRLRPDAHITVGGNFTTRIADRIDAAHPFFDVVDSFVQYEGEDALVDLVDRVDNDRSLVGLPGVLAREHGRLHRSPPATVDLRELPPPDFADFPLADGYLAPGPVLPLMASRSCAWKCAFCSIPFASDKFRIRPPDAVVAEMDELHRRHGSTTFQFVDEIMTVRSMRELSRPLRERSYRWYGETRFHPKIDDGLAGDLYAAGCRRLDLGLESYNQDVLDRMRKDVRASWIAPNLDALLGAGVSVHLFCIAGFPGEARWQTARTIGYARDVIDRSRTSYGVAHSTYGISPFVLDALSPVATNPAAFDVEIVPPPPSRDLEMGLRYHYTGAVPEPATAQERRLAELADRVLGQPAEGEQPPEEVMLLRACGTGDHAPEPPQVTCLGPHWTNAPVELAPGVTAVADDSGGALLAHPATNTILAVPTTLVSGLPCPASELARGVDDLRLLAACVRLGLLRTRGGTQRLSGPEDLHDGIRVELEAGVTLEDAALFSEPTGTRTRLTATGDAIVGMAGAPGGRTIRELRSATSIPLAPFLWRLLQRRLLAASVPLPRPASHPRSREEVTT